VQVTSGSQYGQLAFEVDDSPVYINGSAVTYDGYATSPTTQFVSLGSAHFGGDGSGSEQHTITVDITGKNASSSGYEAAIDDFIIVPINDVTYANLTAAMNNKGVGVDNASAANFEPSTNNYGLSQSTLTTAGLAPGAPVTINGVPFVMPSYRTDSGGNVLADNVMADGQTIGLAASSASKINLLVASTCGQTPSNFNVQLSVNYAGNVSPDDDVLPSVPSWTDQSPTLTNPVGGATISAGPVLAYRLHGTTQDTTPVHLYVISAAANNTQAISSVTLPYYDGSDFSDSCNTAKLHVLAMSTS
jgi:hypothetical protein